jgi:tungstate transport system substrate-binding protein
MYDDFVIVGPRADPAGVKGHDLVKALRALSGARAAFVSRADKSGTHAAELRYWKEAGVAVPPAAPLDYKQCGCGMGPALNIASSVGAYALTDRGTWLNFRNRGDLAVLVEGDKRLFNQYGVIVVDPARHPGVKADLAQRFADWVVSADGQAAIAAYRIDGAQLFFPNADR